MREFANKWEFCPPCPTVLCARCGGHFIDDADGQQAHSVVFGHHPEGLANVGSKL